MCHITDSPKRLLVVLCEDTFEHVGFQTAVNVFTDGENGSETAGTDAAGSFKAELEVFGDAAVGNTEESFQLVHQDTGALNVACGTKTYCNGIGSLGVEKELCVESYNTEHFGEGNVESECDVTLNFLGKISVDILRLLKDGHEASGLILVSSDNCVKSRELFRCTLEGNGSHRFFHRAFVLLRILMRNI